MEQNTGDARQAVLVRSSLVKDAASQGIDIVAAAETGIARAVAKSGDREAWRRENAAAMQDYNRHVAEHGLELNDLRLI